MLDAADEDTAGPASRADASLRRREQFFGVFWRVVGQHMAFEISPTVLDRVQLRRVGREIFERQPPVGALDELLHLGRAMGIEPVPDDDERAFDVAQKLAQELPAPRRINVLLGIESEKCLHFGLIAVTGPRADRPDHRDFGVRSPDLPEDRGLAGRSPGSPRHRRHENPALVDKGDGGARQLGFFLMRDHVRRRQPRIFASSRSMARLSGFCGLQPIFRSKRGM